MMSTDEIILIGAILSIFEFAWWVGIGIAIALWRRNRRDEHE